MHISFTICRIAPLRRAKLLCPEDRIHFKLHGMTQQCMAQQGNAKYCEPSLISISSYRMKW